MTKALIQKTLSSVPQSERWNYFFQRKLSKSLPVSDEKFLQKVQIAVRHYLSFLQYSERKEVSTAFFYEFGAGWELIGPLTYFSLGVEDQSVIDIRPNARFELVNDSLHKFSKHRTKIERMIDKPLRAVGSDPIVKVEDLKDRYGITYCSPLDACNTHFAPESFDFISSTQTLEHIPRSDLFKMLKECNRILKEYGIMSGQIDMKDHYSYFDNSISCYNFLKFSDLVWKFVNSPLHFQNRLRCTDYKEIIELAGFEIISSELEKPNSQELQILQNISVAREFKRRYSLEDLGVKTLWIVARKRRK